MVGVCEFALRGPAYVQGCSTCEDDISVSSSQDKTAAVRVCSRPVVLDGCVLARFQS